MDQPQTFASNRLPIYYVLGAPGAGKGTLCKMLAKEYRCIHLSVGDMLREQLQYFENERLAGSDPAVPGADKLSIDQFKSLMEKRQLLPAAAIVELVRRKISSYGVATIIVDGFPRSLESAQLASKEIGTPSRVLFFDCRADVARDRFLARRRSEDDDGDAFDVRFEQFRDSNSEILTFFREEVGVGHVVAISTTGTTEESWKLLQDKVDGTLATREGGSGGLLLQEGGSGAESVVVEEEEE